METRTLLPSIVRGLFVLSLVSFAACDGNQATSPTQPTLLTAADERNPAVPANGTNGLDAQATLNQDHLPAERAGGEASASPLGSSPAT